MDNCVGGLFSLVDASSRASMFVIHWYRSRISGSVFSVKCLFGSKSLRKPVTKIRNELRRYKPSDSLVVISHGNLIQLVADVDLRRHVQADFCRVSFHEALETSASRSDRHSLTELRVICAVGEYWPTARSHSASSEPATKVRNSGVKMGSHEWSKSETSRFTNFETALSLLPSLSKRQEVVPKLSRTLLVKSPRCRTAVCKLHVCLTFRRLA